MDDAASNNTLKNKICKDNRFKMSMTEIVKSLSKNNC